MSIKEIPDQIVAVGLYKQIVHSDNDEQPYHRPVAHEVTRAISAIL